MLKNYMEIVVDQVYDEIKGLYNRCDSEACDHNIKARALNNLPSYYFDYEASEGEKMAYLVDRQRRISVLAKVAEATSTRCSNCPNSNINKSKD